MKLGRKDDLMWRQQQQQQRGHNECPSYVRIGSPILAPILSTGILPDRRGGGRAFYSLVPYTAEPVVLRYHSDRNYSTPIWTLRPISNGFIFPVTVVPKCCCSTSVKGKCLHYLNKVACMMGSGGRSSEYPAKKGQQVLRVCCCCCSTRLYETSPQPRARAIHFLPAFNQSPIFAQRCCTQDYVMQAQCRRGGYYPPPLIPHVAMVVGSLPFATPLPPWWGRNTWKCLCFTS